MFCANVAICYAVVAPHVIALSFF